MGGALTRKLRTSQQLPYLAASGMSSVYREDCLRAKPIQGLAGHGLGFLPCL